MHNCFFASGESATTNSFVAAGKSKGIEVREFFNIQELEAFQPDFVINFNYLFPKLTRFPTYAAIASPLDDAPNCFLPILITFDGYVAIPGGKVEQFTADMCFRMNKLYPAPYISGHHVPDFDYPPTNLAQAELIYCGHNWDKRNLKLLELLSKHEWFKVYGMAKQWKNVAVNYRGDLPYDGKSLLNAYRTAGVGLSLQGKAFVDYNIASNRIFEITASGAVAIVQRMPFIEEHFGDSVLYIDHTRPDEQLYKDVLAHMNWVRTHPEEAAQKAERATQVVREKFTSERMLEEFIQYHKESMKYGGFSLPIPKERQPEIAVIVRMGGRPIEMVRRAFNSLKNQVYKNIRPVLVLYRKPDYLEELLNEYKTFFSKIDIVECLDGIRSTTLWAGLNHVYNQNISYFSILDDDDEYFPNHISNLFLTLQKHAQQGGASKWAYSLWLSEHENKKFDYWDIQENRKFDKNRVSSLQKSIEEEIWGLSPASVLIKTSLLDVDMLQDPKMHTGEDSYLWQSLFVKNLPVPSFWLTALVHKHDDNSNFATHPERRFDMLKLKTRFLGTRKMDGTFWATDVKIDEPPQISAGNIGRIRLLKSRIARILRIFKKVIIKSPILAKIILNKLEKM